MSLDGLIEATEQELAANEKRRVELIEKLRELKSARDTFRYSLPKASPSDKDSQPLNISGISTANEKIALFRSLFKGREDVFPRRFESKRTGKSGYQPVCKNEWVKGICKKPSQKCFNCDFREFVPLSDENDHQLSSPNEKNMLN
jgi:hypothetical protein